LAGTRPLWAGAAGLSSLDVDGIEFKEALADGRMLALG
jgi:hypothetical protein